MNLTRLSLDIEKGWPVAKPDEKGPLCFYSDASSLLTASEARVKELEAMLRRYNTAVSPFIRNLNEHWAMTTETEGLVAGLRYAMNDASKLLALGDVTATKGEAK